MSAKVGRVPYGLAWRSSTTFIIGSVTIGLFTDLFLYGLVVPVLPYALRQRSNVADEDIQTVTARLLAVYAAASFLTAPVIGILVDRSSRRRGPFMFGLVALTAATALFAFGHSLWVLTIARLLQGISAGLVWTVGFTMVIDTVGTERLGATVGSIFGFISFGSLIAPTLGGILYSTLGYYAIFVAAGIILLIDIGSRMLVLEKVDAEKYARIGQATNERTWLIAQTPTTPMMNVELAAAPLFIRLFPFVSLLKHPRLLAALLSSFTVASAYGVYDATIPLHAERMFGFDALKSGVLFVALTVPELVLSPVFGAMVDRHGPRWIAVIGHSFLAVSLILLRIPTAEAGWSSQALLYAFLLGLNALGLALLSSIGIVESSRVVEEAEAANQGRFGPRGPWGQLYSVQNFVYSAGMTFGPMLAGTLSEKIGYGNAMAIIAVLSFITAVICGIYMQGAREESEGEDE